MAPALGSAPAGTRGLAELERASTGIVKLRPLLQPAQAAQLDRRTASDQPRSQRLWVLQLGREPIEDFAQAPTDPRRGDAKHRPQRAPGCRLRGRLNIPVRRVPKLLLLHRTPAALERA
jgi:hypothetical protein